MSEALTPHLTREQYRMGYLKALGDEIANETYNLSAVEAYNQQGQSVQDALNQSATLTQGIPLATLKAVNAVKMRGTVENATAAVAPLNLRAQQFVYTASDAINQLLQSGYMGGGGRRVSPQIFRQVVSDMMRGALNEVPQYANPLVPSAVEGDNVDPAETMVTNQVVNDQVNQAMSGVPSQSASRQFDIMYGHQSHFSKEQLQAADADTRKRMREVNQMTARKEKGSTRGRKAEEEFQGGLDEDDNIFGPAAEQHEYNPKYFTKKGELRAKYKLLPKSTQKILIRRHGPAEPSGSETVSEDTIFKGNGLPLGRQNVPYPIEQRYQRSIRGTGLMVGNKPMAPFGSYLIDMEDLRNNQLSLYTAKGNKQKRVPQAVIGGNVSNVIKSLVVGQRPRPKDILSLSEDEREYLSGVGVAAKIEDLQEMPTKKKTELQKDMHEFEVLRGQIAAGNDNKELIQDFKKKLLKMIHGKKVSKAQGHDLLLELAAMGI
jgi:hypothetical protein